MRETCDLLKGVDTERLEAVDVEDGHARGSRAVMGALGPLDGGVEAVHEPLKDAVVPAPRAVEARRGGVLVGMGSGGGRWWGARASRPSAVLQCAGERIARVICLLHRLLLEHDVLVAHGKAAAAHGRGERGRGHAKQRGEHLHRGNQKQSEAISSNQKRSEVVRRAPAEVRGVA